MADTHSDCGLAQTAFGPCVPYMIGQDPKVSAQCCQGVQAVKDLASSPAAGRSICECLKSELASAGSINSARAAALSGNCRITINLIPISSSFNCNK
ncbi:Plant non-specific lipid-transfer protein/Par allergen protein [Dioscorea alata]|uniref:Plant non-specific lipid-transfer protein/Par allergen protein n=1 Tax=Dioscorea alata TaxID=55571 RepID=A0ACB7UCU9_DIOAL|nr:Plant non-specific lipid-transfer protein/Par allergen protein [Dioscorea alata]